ncbi:methyltransferase putative [Firmicutes bacterium CAG:822]|nr:methyltransferase putative [Firmicutes bacterium CAG:822]
MRIISGKYKGKKLNGFNIEGTRPTMDRVKESLFGMIQTYIPDSIVLDLFAGSGALGLEAVSNGAKECYLIDNNVEAIKTIKENSQNFEEQLNIIHIDYKKFLKTTDKKFDIIFLDPPYKEKQLDTSLRIIEERGLLNENGIVICEYEIGEPHTNLELIKEKSYGPKKIKIYKNNL